MAELQAKTVTDIGIDRSELKDEELGVLNLIQNTRVADAEKKETPGDGGKTDANKDAGYNQQSTNNRSARLSVKEVKINKDVLGVNVQEYNSWMLHTPNIQQKRQRIAFAVFCILEFPGRVNITFVLFFSFKKVIPAYWSFHVGLTPHSYYFFLSKA